MVKKDLATDVQELPLDSHNEMDGPIRDRKPTEKGKPQGILEADVGS